MAYQNSKNSARRDTRRELTDRIIKELNNGTLPWQNPWPKGMIKERPRNNITGANYKGINVVNLELSGHADPRWMTYKQAEKAGYHVKKGAKGERIEYWNMQEYTVKEKKVDPDTGEIKEYEVAKKRPVGNTYTVFNAENIDGVAPYYSDLTKNLPEKELNDRAERLIKATGAKIQFDSPGEAFYDKHTEVIHLSPRYTYNTTYDMYSSILHQLAHWTSSKMDRKAPEITEDKDGYMREELRVELACYFLAHDLGIGATQDHIKSHSSFIAPWVKLLKLNKHEIFSAAREADKISDFLLSYLPELKRDKETAKDEVAKTAEPTEAKTEDKPENKQENTQDNTQVKETTEEKKEEHKTQRLTNTQDLLYDLSF